MFRIYNQNTKECLYDDSLLESEDNCIREPKLTMEVDKAGSLTFIAKPGTSISLKDILYVTKNNRNGEEILYWGCEVANIERDSYNDLSVECEGVLSYLNDTLQVASITSLEREPVVHFETMLNYHNATILNRDECKFTLSNISKTADYASIVRALRDDGAIIYIYYLLGATRTRESSYDNIKREFLDYLKGHIAARSVGTVSTELASNGHSLFSFTNEIDYIDPGDTVHRQVSGQTIEFGKNLVSITKRVSIEDFATVYIPQGRSLTEPEKAWPYIQKKSNTQYTLIEEDPESPETVNYRTGMYIDSEKGEVKSTSNTNFVVTQDIPVMIGEKFFLTTYLIGPDIHQSGSSNSYVGALTYAIVTSDGRLVSSGSQARNSADSSTGVVTTARIEIEDQDITIPETDIAHSKIVIDNIAYDFYLRIGKVMSNEAQHDFCLKKYNPRYGESNISIMSAPIMDVSESNPISKPVIFNDERADVYPISTSSQSRIESFESSRKMYNQNLVNTFGIIQQVYTNSDADTPFILEESAARDLRKMEELIELEIQAVDLSFIDESVPEFKLMDLVHVISEPHGIDVKLPIMKFELPLDSPENGIYTLTNDRVRDPSMISQYMKTIYDKVERKG